MAFTPEQYWQIAAAYEKAAADYMVPPQHRKAFAQKADWFRMLARIGAKQKLFGVPPRELTASTPWIAEARKCIQTPVTYLRGSSVGSLAMLLATRRASSIVSGSCYDATRLKTQRTIKKAARPIPNAV